MKNYCKDCGKEITEEAVRCKPCWYIFMKKNKLFAGKNNPKYIDGRKKKKYYCCDCGKLLSDYTATRCFSCCKIEMGKRHQRENNPNWKGGSSLEIYPSEFNPKLKRKIFKRDNYTCQRCNIYPTNDLTCHHIDYNKFNCKEDNLITICFKCNLEVNADRDYWFAYFTYIMKESEYGK